MLEEKKDSGPRPGAGLLPRGAEPRPGAGLLPRGAEPRPGAGLLPRGAEPYQSSNREFGFVMAGAFLLFTALSAWKHRGWPAAYLPALSGAFFVITLTAPRLLTPLNLAWSMLGRLLHRLVSPVILGVLYFAVLTPFGLVFRAIKKDPLRLKLDPTLETYWIKREEQPGKGMANQF